MWKMDYDTASMYWIEREKDESHMEEAELLKRIETFLGEHNTCALATAHGDFVRCTPIEYNYLDGHFYLFSEGGLKFKALKENKQVSLSIFESYSGFNTLKSLQVVGEASMVEPYTDEYMKLMEYKKIPADAFKRMNREMYLIKIKPASFDLLDSHLKQDGFSNRQHLDV